MKEDIQNRYTAAPRACKKPSLRDRCLQIPRTAAGFEPMRHAKSTPKRWQRYLWNPLKKIYKIAIRTAPKPLDDTPSKSLEQQQDSSPCHAKSTPKKCLTLPLESIKEDLKIAKDIQNRYTNSTKTILDDTPSKSLEQQQDSSPCHAKSTPKKCLTSPLESIKEDIQNRYRYTKSLYEQH